MGSRNPSLEDADALLLMAEELVATARAAGVRLGLHGEASGLTVLQHAYALAVADAIGPRADRSREVIGCQLAASQLVESVVNYRRLRTLEAQRRG